MTRKAGRIALATIAVASLLSLAIVLAFEDVARDPIAPADAPGLARWLSEHPADWLAASALTDRALDSSLPRRVEIWRGSHALATRLAPLQPNAAAAFVRSGLFHWYELDDADRRRVLDATKPLLRDPDTFRQLAIPLWRLTRDFSLLRNANPGTPEAYATLRDLAITYGLFEDYRAMRTQLKRARLAAFEEDPVVHSLFAQLPRPIDTADEPLIRRMLEALKAKPIESHHNVEALIVYALDHRLQPLDGLAPAVHFAELPAELRVRLARALGMDQTAREIELRNGLLTGRATSGGEWTGTCGTNEVCTSAFRNVRGGGKTAIVVRTVQSDDVAPYVEIYVDDALRAEKPVEDGERFEVELGDEGLHKIEVRVANPLTRNRVQRRVALSS